MHYTIKHQPKGRFDLACIRREDRDTFTGRKQMPLRMKYYGKSESPKPERNVFKMLYFLRHWQILSNSFQLYYRQYEA